MLTKRDKVEVTGIASNDNGVYTIENLKITGSEVNDQFAEKMKVRWDLNKVYAANQKKHAAVRERMMQASQFNDTMRINEVRASSDWKAMEADETEFFKQVKDGNTKVLSENKNSWWGELLALNLFSYFPLGYAYLYDELADSAKNSYYGQILKGQVKAESLLGKQSPAIQAKDQKGNSFDMQKTAAGKKYILVDFWASWCAPCRRKMPELKAFYKKYKDQGLEMVGISIDKKKADWAKASAEEKLPYLNYLDLGETGNNWKIRAIPAVFLLDPTGKVLAEEISLNELEKMILKNK